MKQIQTPYDDGSHCRRSVVATLAVVLDFRFYQMTFLIAFVIQ